MTISLKELDLMVALLEGWELDPLRPLEEKQIRRHYLNIPPDDFTNYIRHGDYQYTIAGVGYAPTTNWNQGGPIVEREGLCIMKSSIDDDFYQPVLEYGEIVSSKNSGKTFLEAAMRAYIDKIESSDINKFNIQSLTQEQWHILINSLLDPESIQFYEKNSFLLCSMALGISGGSTIKIDDNGHIVLKEPHEEVMSKINFVRQKKTEGFSFVDSINLYFKDNPPINPLAKFKEN